MVKALRYWVQASGLTEEVKVQGNKREQYLTKELGQIIFEKDPYFEDLFSLWIVIKDCFEPRKRGYSKN